ncbi:MAG TPA: hypothetical protein V6C97_21370 [Oculatellaceae cyanobacterium]
MPHVFHVAVFFSVVVSVVGSVSVVVVVVVAAAAVVAVAVVVVVCTWFRGGIVCVCVRVYLWCV